MKGKTKCLILVGSIRLDLEDGEGHREIKKGEVHFIPNEYAENVQNRQYVEPHEDDWVKPVYNERTRKEGELYEELKPETERTKEPEEPEELAEGYYGDIKNGDPKPELPDGWQSLGRSVLDDLATTRGLAPHDYKNKTLLKKAIAKTESV